VPFKNIASFLLTENPSRSEEHSTDPKGLTSKPQGSTRRIIICIKKEKMYRSRSPMAVQSAEREVNQ
jgi:hypothetical protein